MTPDQHSVLVAVMLVVAVGTVLKLLRGDSKPRKKLPPFYTKSGNVNRYYTQWPR
jgi:hypothetical protein